MNKPKQTCGCCNQKKMVQDFETVQGYGNGEKYVCADCARWMRGEIQRLKLGEER